MITTRILIAACVALIAYGIRPAAQQTTVVFDGVSVISMSDQVVTPNRSVLVSGGTIAAIGAPGMKVPDGATRVDGRGQYLMPALAEMHAHIPADAAEAERVLFLYVANGIGTIRSMLGDPAHFRLRERVNRGEIVGPAMYLAGPSFNGQTSATAAAASTRVAEQKKAGYDLLKIHPGVPRDAFDALDASADKLGIPFAGHVPAAVGLPRALDARFWTIDHLDGYVEALAGSGAPPSQNFGINLVSHVDESRIAALAKDTRSAGVWNVPTQILLESWYGPESPEAMQAWPEIQYANPGEVAQWVATKRKNLAAFSAQDREKFIAVRRRLIKALQDAGAGLLLGSDAPQVWNVPGFSIHRELGTYVASGLTPYQALATGTRNVAEHLKTNGGVIRQGARADLVLLDANPLQDIGNTRRITGVMVNGRWLPKSELDRRLAELRRR